MSEEKREVGNLQNKQAIECKFVKLKRKHSCAVWKIGLNAQ
jgi:hypothetical protein